MISFFEWLFNHDQYTTGCAIAAFFLFFYSVKPKSLSMLILLLEFSACKIVAVAGLKTTSLLDNSGLFLAYSLIQAVAIYSLYMSAKKGYEISILVTVLISLAAIYNILMIAPYHGYAVFGFSGEQMYNVYSNLLGFIMLMQLFYMASYNKLLISKLGKHARTYTVFTDRFYMSYCRPCVGGVM